MRRFLRDLRDEYGFWVAFLYGLACAFPVVTLFHVLVTVIMAALR